MFYDGTKMLSMKDLNNNTPELFLCTTNRSGGKTTYFNRFMFNKFLQGKGKMIFLYRFNYELYGCDEKIFKNIGELFFKKDRFSYKPYAKGVYNKLYFNDNECGYALCLNSADSIKKLSHVFSDCQRMMFDEFQSETNHYCNEEISKFISIHTSVARGGGKQSRYVPVYMCANCVTLLNPYYTALGIGSRLQKDTKFLRGNGWVLEQGFNQSAYEAQTSSLFNQAFAQNNYVSYSNENIYLNDNNTFIAKVQGENQYFCTLKYNNINYSVRLFPSQGIVYCSPNSVDTTFPIKIAVTTNDFTINYVLLKQNQYHIDTLKYYFSKGCFRFYDLASKECIFKLLSY